MTPHLHSASFVGYDTGVVCKWDTKLLHSFLFSAQWYISVVYISNLRETLIERRIVRQSYTVRVLFFSFVSIAAAKLGVKCAPWGSLCGALTLKRCFPLWSGVSKFVLSPELTPRPSLSLSIPSLAQTHTHIHTQLFGHTLKICRLKGFLKLPNASPNVSDWGRRHTVALKIPFK